MGCRLLKRLLVDSPHVRLVVMSATLQAKLFGPYFWQPGDPAEPPAALFVGTRSPPSRRVTRPT